MRSYIVLKQVIHAKLCSLLSTWKNVRHVLVLQRQPRYLSLTISILHRGADTLHTSDLNDDYLTQTHRYLKVERSSDPSDLSPASFSFREQLPYLP